MWPVWFSLVWNSQSVTKKVPMRTTAALRCRAVIKCHKKTIRQTGTLLCSIRLTLRLKLAGLTTSQTYSQSNSTHNFALTGSVMTDWQMPLGKEEKCQRIADTEEQCSTVAQSQVQWWWKGASSSVKTKRIHAFIGEIGWPWWLVAGSLTFIGLFRSSLSLGG